MRKSEESTADGILREMRHNTSDKPVSACRTRPIQGLLPPKKIYKVLHERLFDDGCLVAAKIFQRLVAKEDDLAQTDLKFKKRVRDNQCLLLAIVDNLKSAETAYCTNGDKELTLKLLIQTIHMIQQQDDAYHWVVKEAYTTILKMAERWDFDIMEMVARIRFEYGVVLTEREDNQLSEAVIQMSRALELCKGTMWYTNDKDRNILHEDVCIKLCETLLRQAKLASKIAPHKAADLAYRAVHTITEVGISGNKNLYCIAKLRQSEYLIGSKDYRAALRVLENVHKHIMSHDSPRNKCEFYLLLGICHFNISSHAVALRKFKLSLCLSENYDFADLRAQALLCKGKIHAQNESTQDLARQCFLDAKQLFQRLKDVENVKLAKFLMAKLRAYQIFPSYIELIGKASQNNFCYLFDLIQWKQKMQPFWNEHRQLHCHENEYQCLLDEDVSKDVILKLE